MILAALAADLGFGERELLDMDTRRLAFWSHASIELGERRRKAAKD